MFYQPHKSPICGYTSRREGLERLGAADIWDDYDDEFNGILEHFYGYCVNTLQWQRECCML